MTETYLDAAGELCCDDCDEQLYECTCTCDVTGDSVHECAGPGCEHEEGAVSTQTRTPDAIFTDIGATYAGQPDPARLSALIMTTLDEMKQRMADMATRYADADTCECGALIEEIDLGGETYWAHVKRMRIHYDHAAVPTLPSA